MKKIELFLYTFFCEIYKLKIFSLLFSSPPFSVSMSSTVCKTVYKLSSIVSQWTKKYPDVPVSKLNEPLLVSSFKEALHFFLLEKIDDDFVLVLKNIVVQLTDQKQIKPYSILWFFQSAIVHLTFWSCPFIAACEATLLEIIALAMGIGREEKKQQNRQVTSLFSAAPNHVCLNFLDVLEDNTVEGKFVFNEKRASCTMHFVNNEGPSTYCDSLPGKTKFTFMKVPYEDKVTGQIRCIETLKELLGFLYKDEPSLRKKLTLSKKKWDAITNFQKKFRTKSLSHFYVESGEYLSLLAQNGVWLRPYFNETVTHVALKAAQTVRLQLQIPFKSMKVETKIFKVNAVYLAGVKTENLDIKAKLKLVNMEEPYQVKPKDVNPKNLESKFAYSRVSVLLDADDFIRTKSYGNERFQYNSELAAIAWPETYAELPKEANKGAYGLKYVDLPPYIKHLRRNVFSLCYNLKELVLPGGVMTMDLYAFPHVNCWPTHPHPIGSYQSSTCGITHITMLGVYLQRDRCCHVRLNNKPYLWRRLLNEHKVVTFTCPKEVFVWVRSYVFHGSQEEVVNNEPWFTTELKWDEDSYSKLLKRYFWHYSMHKPQQHPDPSLKWLGHVDVLRPLQNAVVYTFFLCMNRGIRQPAEDVQSKKRRKQDDGTSVLCDHQFKPDKLRFDQKIVENILHFVKVAELGRV